MLSLIFIDLPLIFILLCIHWLILGSALYILHIAIGFAKETYKDLNFVSNFVKNPKNSIIFLHNAYYPRDNTEGK